MPELPEVETIRRQLDAKLHGKTVTKVTLFRSGREFPKGKKFVVTIAGKKIKSISRRAKLLVWNFTDGTAMLAHLKMTGRFVFVDGKYEPKKHDSAMFCFVGAHAMRPGRVAHARTEYLVWSDVRKFGFVKFVQAPELKSVLACYGPEPLEARAEELADRLKTPKTRMVKVALLNQEVIAGVGNIYADEALHRAKIRPTRRLGSLTREERLKLGKEIQKVLCESIELGGTSANDYVDASGRKGKFLDFLRVYGRKGEECRDCGTPIKRIVIGQRSTHYCPTCQK
ncbi:bifunctional DNA-formamidopyrimidine glycosylase/DNA-(apurinic or apyrimidinic site) lyase [Candidatus Uhrbacteria bacterium]|nr:bifunctional DNA-formamidopyrimidine glycosylase/DNA-(apurinic or apyrimidinic site) lyase [Candidatus Uhrbacteria bacterium]